MNCLCNFTVRTSEDPEGSLIKIDRLVMTDRMTNSLSWQAQVREQKRECSAAEVSSNRVSK